jgi:hypothetical protein
MTLSAHGEAAPCNFVKRGGGADGKFRNPNPHTAVHLGQPTGQLNILSSPAKITPMSGDVHQPICAACYSGPILQQIKCLRNRTKQKTE